MESLAPPNCPQKRGQAILRRSWSAHRPRLEVDSGHGEIDHRFQPFAILLNLRAATGFLLTRDPAKAPFARLVEILLMPHL